MLATANRSRVSIPGQLCKNLPHIYFDHQAKFGSCFSYCVHACTRSQNLADTGPHSLAWAWLIL